MMLRILLWAVFVVVALVAAVVTVGWMLPKAHIASADATVRAARETVRATILDVRRYPEWRTDVKQVDVLADAPLRWKEHGSHGVITYEVREQHAPDRVVTAIDDPTLPFGGTWTYELADAGTSTRVRITEHGEVRNPVFRFISRVFLSPTATMEQYLAALDRRLR